LATYVGSVGSVQFYVQKRLRLGMRWAVMVRG
jgi:hypothetical protein